MITQQDIKLINIYTGDIVYTKDYKNVQVIDGNEFLKVYSPENPQRSFLVNKKAFNVINK